MIRLTVLYNLPPETDEAAFLRWRLTEHQAENAAMPGVTYTDFTFNDSEWLPDGVLHTGAKYRFMTIADFTDRATFEAHFLEPQAVATLQKDLHKIRDAVFLVGEVLAVTDTTATS